MDSFKKALQKQDIVLIWDNPQYELCNAKYQETWIGMNF